MVDDGLLVLPNDVFAEFLKTTRGYITFGAGGMVVRTTTSSNVIQKALIQGLDHSLSMDVPFEPWHLQRKSTDKSASISTLIHKRLHRRHGEICTYRSILPPTSACFSSTPCRRNIHCIPGVLSWHSSVD